MRYRPDRPNPAAAAGDHPDTMVQIAVCRNSGFSGLYQGMNAKLLHTVLTSALLFLGYERLVQVSHRQGKLEVITDTSDKYP